MWIQSAGILSGLFSLNSFVIATILLLAINCYMRFINIKALFGTLKLFLNQQSPDTRQYQINKACVSVNVCVPNVSVIKSHQYVIVRLCCWVTLVTLTLLSSVSVARGNSGGGTCFP